MSRPISSLSEDDTDTDDYPADNELSSNLPMHADEDDADDKENHHPLINQHQPTLLPPLALPTTSAFSSPTKRPPHKRHRPSPSSTAAAAVSPSHDPNLVLLDIGGILFQDKPLHAPLHPQYVLHSPPHLRSAATARQQQW